MKAVEGRVEVYMDGGVRRGTDVLKAHRETRPLGSGLQWTGGSGEGSAGTQR